AAWSPPACIWSRDFLGRKKLGRTRRGQGSGANTTAVGGLAATSLHLVERFPWKEKTRTDEKKGRIGARRRIVLSCRSAGSFLPVAAMNEPSPKRRSTAVSIDLL